MKLLITPSNPELVLVAFNSYTGKSFHIPAEPCHLDEAADPTRPPMRPFGITWCDEYVYVANRTNLIIFDKEMNTHRVVRGILDQNTHQITYHKGELIVTMTRCDSIAFIDPVTGSRRFFHPYDGWSDDIHPLDHQEEKHHINSVVAKGDLVYMLLGNRGRKCSSVAVLDLNTGLTEWVVDLNASKSHGLYVGPEGIGTLDTGGNHDLVIKDHRIGLYASDVSFCRGLAGNARELACGHFNKTARRFRGEGGSAIKIVRDGKVDEAHHIQDIGAINDMRLIDGDDFCHHNEFAFPAKVWLKETVPN